MQLNKKIKQILMCSDENCKTKLDDDVKLKFTGSEPTNILLKRELLNRIQPSMLLHEMSPPVWLGTKVCVG